MQEDNTSVSGNSTDNTGREKAQKLFEEKLQVLFGLYKKNKGTVDEDEE